jgi:putative acetyltransferase
MTHHQTPITIRSERPEDKDAVYAVNRAAFGREDEARLVDTMRQAGDLSLSLVALVAGRIVGHVAFSSVTIQHNPTGLMVLGLAPIAVLPDYQRQGVGKALILEGLAQCRAMGTDAIVLVGHTSYYPRFGFLPASRYDLKYKGEDFGDAFMILEITQGAAAQLSGRVDYVAAFDEVT